LDINQWEIKIRWILGQVDNQDQDVDTHAILWIILQEMLATSCSIPQNLWHLFNRLITRILLPVTKQSKDHGSRQEKVIMTFTL
jgi:hypothetical protein